MLDGAGTTNDEVWLPSPAQGDDDLQSALEDISAGTELRPGVRLAPFAIDWVVIEGPDTVLDEVLVAQLDLAPVPLDPGSRVYENHTAAPIAGSPDVPWQREGLDFVGDPVAGPVPLSVNYDEGWAPSPTQTSWYVSVDGSLGSATFSGSGLDVGLAVAVASMVVASLGLIVVGRRRR